jgi:hypothetical protein
MHMPKPRPVEIHVNSKGKKQYKLQELIHSQKGYVFVPIDGKMKTDLFNKGLLDGRKHPVRLERTYDSCSGTKEVLAFSSTDFSDKISNLQLTGVVPLDQTFLVPTGEADRFLSTICEDCEYLGMHDCFLRDFRCTEIDREKYCDGAWFELKKDLRKERKRLAFPVKG